MSKELVKINDKNNNARKKGYKKSKKFAFGLLWFLFLIRIFIADVGYIVNQKITGFDSLKFVVVRLLILSLTIILIWIQLGNKRFWKNVGLLFIFPVYPFGINFVKRIGWDVPKYLFEKKYTGLLINYFDTVVKYFFNLKRNLAIQITSILTFIFLFSLNGYWLLIPIGSLAFLMVYHLYGRYTQTFEPIKLFQINVERFSKVEGEIFNKEKFEETISETKKTNKVDEPISGDGDLLIAVNEDENKSEQSESLKLDQNEKISLEIDEDGKIIDKGLEKALVISQFVQVFKHKMEDVLTSRSYMKSFIWKAIYSFLFAMVIFGGINYATYNINPLNYKSDFVPTFFDFFYYSFFTIIPDGTDIEPVTRISKSIKMIGVGVGVFINLLILAVYFTVSSDRYKENLERIVKIADEYSKGANNYFIEKYGRSPTDAMKDLKGKIKDFENQISFWKNLLKIK